MKWEQKFRKNLLLCGLNHQLKMAELSCNVLVFSKVPSTLSMGFKLSEELVKERGKNRWGKRAWRKMKTANYPSKITTKTLLTTGKANNAFFNHKGGHCPAALEHGDHLLMGTVPAEQNTGSIGDRSSTRRAPQTGQPLARVEKMCPSQLRVRRTPNPRDNHGEKQRNC